MKYVLDASVALKRVLKEEDTAKADQVHDDFRQKLHELLAPDTFPVEVAHALAKAERRGIIPQGDADKLLTEVLSPPPQLHSYLPLLRGHSTSRPRPESESTIASTWLSQSGRAADS